MRGCPRSIVRALKFGLVGIANTGLDFALFTGLTLGAGLSPVAANVASYSAGIALSFTLNRAWTFRDRNRRRAWTQLLMFAAGSLAGLAVSTTVVALLVPLWGPLPAKAASVGVTFAWNYLFSNFVVFKRSAPPAETREAPAHGPATTAVRAAEHPRGR